MSDPILGEITIFAGNFSPSYWAYCQGQTMQIAQNSALYSLLSTMYGGDGRTTFCLPDLRDRCALGPGVADPNTGRAARNIGEFGGAETVTLGFNELPTHNHLAQSGVSGAISVSSTLKGTTSAAGSMNPSGCSLAGTTANMYYRGAANTSMNASSIESTASHTLQVATTVGNTGSGNAHNNMQPWLCLGYIIALAGIYPTRD